MKIGLSLPPDYLAGNQAMGTAATVWHDAFGRVDGCLKALQHAGIRSIEVRHIAEGAAPDLALDAARRVWEAGLDLTIHGHLPKSVSGATFTEIYPALTPLVEAMRERAYESVMTLHCYSAIDGNIDKLTTIYRVDGMGVLSPP